MNIINWILGKPSEKKAPTFYNHQSNPPKFKVEVDKNGYGLAKPTDVTSGAITDSQFAVKILGTVVGLGIGVWMFIGLVWPIIKESLSATVLDVGTGTVSFTPVVITIVIGTITASALWAIFR